MKYYHVIYNSSERPLDGGVGFGIRTATEGTPESVLKAIRGTKFFTDDWESYENKPTPAKMKETPSLIESIPKNYAVTSISDGQEKAYFIIARRAYVGFDYSFYKNGMPTRLGNYVIDYYVFDSAPESSAFEILYEKPIEGANHFVPKSVCPTDDNEEMRLISIGIPKPLPNEERPFTASLNNSLDKDVIKLFFYYLKSKAEGKKLVIRADSGKALKLTADLYRLTDKDYAKSIRIYTNLRSQGTNDNFDIFFIQNDYPHQIYTELYNYIDINSMSLPDTNEARAFGKELEKLVADSFEDNRLDINDILRWLRMPEYNQVKSLSKHTVESFFCYCIQPGNFLYENIRNSEGNLNEEFLKVLCQYTKKSEANADRFNFVVADTMKNITAKSMSHLIKEYNKLQDIGFNLDRVTDDIKYVVCDLLVSDKILLKQALDSFKFDGIVKFFVKSLFEAKKEFLDSPLLDDYTLELYKWFLTEKELSDGYSFLYDHFLRRDIKSSIFTSLIDDVYGNEEEQKVNFFIRVLKKEGKPFDVIWPYLEHYLNNVKALPNLFEEFKEHLADKQYASMFYYYIKRNKSNYSSIESIEQLTNILAKNNGLRNLIINNYETDGLYNSFYNQVKNVSRDNKEEALMAIRDNILDFLMVKDKKFILLALYLDMAISENTSTIKNLNFQERKGLFDVIVEFKNARLFKALLPDFIEASRKGYINTEKLASIYAQFNPGVHTIEMLSVFVTNCYWPEMITAIIYEVRHKPFAKAFELCKSIGLDNETFESFMNQCYSKEYMSWKRKNRFKNFFRNVVRVFSFRKKAGRHRNPE